MLNFDHKLEEINGPKPKKTQNTKKSTKPQENTTEPEPAKEPDPPKRELEDFPAFFESYSGSFWTQNGLDEWQRFSTDAMTCNLKTRGYSSEKGKYETASEVEYFLHKIRFFNAIHWAGELAGWDVGLHDISNKRILITKGREPIIAKKGDYPHFKQFLTTLLPGNQSRIFLAWLKGSLQSLQDGYPFQPGQMLALVGGVNCGKSFLQKLVTYILGGRQGDPTAFFVGKEKNTAEFISAEHLLIEDQALKDCTRARRRGFAANLKAMVVNSDQRIRGMRKDAQLLPINTRITLSCNETPHAVSILPQLEADVSDKLIYLKCGNGDLPQRSKPNMTRGQQLELFLNELPAVVSYLERWKIPDSLRDPVNRFAVRGWQHPEVVRLLQDMSDEERLLDLFGVLDLQWPLDGFFVGTAAKVEKWMRDKDSSRMLDPILTYPAAMGNLLTNIATEGEERIKVVEKGYKTVYQINRNEF